MVYDGIYSLQEVFMRSVGLVYLVLILAAYALLYRVSPDKTRQSLQAAVRSLVKVLPFLVAIFALIGLFQAFVPPAQIEARFGASAGWA
ncbi:MAG: hypothetical protein C0617_09110 [Desulfuromonas sp.]|nr:MAG: hypothetical protein C0617_09110 [Desulfuromonas sp.]